MQLLNWPALLAAWRTAYPQWRSFITKGLPELAISVLLDAQCGGVTRHLDGQENRPRQPLSKFFGCATPQPFNSATMMGQLVDRCRIHVHLFHRKAVVGGVLRQARSSATLFACLCLLPTLH
jgi:hypothetical protein